MIYMNTWTSIATFTNQRIQEIVANGVTPANSVLMFDWENSTNIEEAPAFHLVGPASLGIEEVSPGIHHVSFVIGVGSFNDEGLHTHRQMVDLIYNSVKSGTRIAVYNATTESEYSWLKLTDGTGVAPMTRSNTRALQFIQAEGLLDPLA